MTPSAGFFFGMFVGAMIGVCLISVIEAIFETAEWVRKLKDKDKK